MSVLTFTRYGEMEYLAGDSIVSRALELYGEWAQLEVDVLGAFINPGDTVLDVGAFLGTHTLAFANMVGPNGTVHSFEPRQAISRLLSNNVERNGHRHVKVHSAALGAVNKELTISAIDTEIEQNFGGLAIEEISKNEDRIVRSVERIQILPLDDFKFDRLDFIKIDVEGMEAEAIRGGFNTFRLHRPVIFVECNDLSKGSLTLQSCLNMDYFVFGVLSPAFNPSNFKGTSENIFFNAAEVSLLGIPQEKFENFAGILNFQKYPTIDSLDALSLFLLNKPQYVGEVLARTKVANILGLEFANPLSRRLESELFELRTALDAHQVNKSFLEKTNKELVERADAYSKNVIRLTREVDEERSARIAETSSLAVTITASAEEIARLHNATINLGVAMASSTQEIAGLKSELRRAVADCELAERALTLYRPTSVRYLLGRVKRRFRRVFGMR